MRFFGFRLLVADVYAAGYAASQAAHQTAFRTPLQAATTRAPPHDETCGKAERSGDARAHAGGMLRGAYGPSAPTTICSITTSIFASIRRSNAISGKNTIRFRMLKDGTRIQLDLRETLNIDKILLGATALKYERDSGAVFVDFPETLHAGTGLLDRLLLLRPSGRDGAVRRDDLQERSGGPPLDQHRLRGRRARASGGRTKTSGATKWRAMDISVAIPNGLVDVSNGKFVGKTDLGDGYTRWDWHVSYPINNYDVSLNIGELCPFFRQAGRPAARFLRAAGGSGQGEDAVCAGQGDAGGVSALLRRVSVREGRIQAVEVPYSGMEHQSAVTYGNLFKNGYHGPRLDGRGDQHCGSTSSSFTRAGTSGLATALPRPTRPTCGFTRAGRRTWRPVCGVPLGQGRCASST